MSVMRKHGKNYPNPPEVNIQVRKNSVPNFHLYDSTLGRTFLTTELVHVGWSTTAATVVFASLPTMHLANAISCRGMRLMH